MLYRQEDYREWLHTRIEGEVGRLDGEGRGLYSLDTESLEKLYKRLTGVDPKHSWAVVLETAK